MSIKSRVDRPIRHDVWLPRTCLFSILFLSACTLFDGNDADSTDTNFRENYEKWIEKDLAHYTFTLYRYCFCPGRYYPAQIVVKADTIYRALDPDSQEPVSIDSTQTYADVYLTVEDLFDLISDAFEREADQLDVTYNKEFGYPENIDIDYSKDVVDEEMRYEINSFSDIVKKKSYIITNTTAIK